MIDTIAFAVVWVVLIIATWDIENTWKRWCLLIVAFMAISTLRVAEGVEGYDKGACAIYEQMDNLESITIKNIPERC